ncbi:MarR family winged helix-turn-helix transcriptional regulator [Enemella evansiae]|uniref:MarR family winged helix-turn-helix transcriptional regulator n=1 Tax=Enemella evansiae TaxID=2016499 RepID=UPI000B9604A4|nr:MarR family transcriptional regulator [Enemella evansiae]OYO08277.1 transcriptional regulator [Enemella evansiae]TDO86178.1 DNA-binding MarR family transcriptional regulator [Enemella evansiae]
MQAELTRRSAAVPVWRALLEVYADLLGELGRRLQARHGLSVTEFDVLINLGPTETCRHRELAGRVLLSGSALTRLVDRLSARGYLTRTRAHDDDRGVLIALTDTGRVLRREAARTNNATIRRAFAGLTDDDLVTLTALLGRIGVPTEEEELR